MTWVIPVAIGAAQIQQQDVIGKTNQAIQNRNAQIAEQKSEALKEQTKFDLARFDQQFEQLTGETKVATLKSGVELSGSALNILRYNAEQAEVQKDVMEYNSKVAQSQKIEEANFARIKGVIARREGKIAALGSYARAGSSLLNIGTATGFIGS